MALSLNASFIYIADALGSEINLAQIPGEMHDDLIDRLCVKFSLILPDLCD